jgi:hypothetical protein
VRDFMGIVRAIEGLYPKAKGTLDPNFPNQDDQLRLQITPFADELFREVERMRRWRLSWTTGNVVTNPGFNSYNLPVDCSTIKRIWWRRSSGSIQILRRADEAEIRLVKGEPPSNPGPNNLPPPFGEPRFWAEMPPLTEQFNAGSQREFNIWPAPDSNGPTSGNYTLFIDYYAELPQIVETTSTQAGASGSLTLPTNAGSYAIAQGVNPASGSGQQLTVRGAGNPTGITLVGSDDFTAGWLAITASAVTLSGGATTITNVTNAPTYFNSVNWLIRSFPKVVVFGMLREVASYFSSQDYQKWEARYQKELEQLVEWDDDTESGVEVMGVATQGQLQPIFRDLDLPELYDIRGGGP